jgi:hypothetical protein
LWQLLLINTFSKLGALSKSATGFLNVPTPHILLYKYSKLFSKRIKNGIKNAPVKG